MLQKIHFKVHSLCTNCVIELWVVGPGGCGGVVAVNWYLATGSLACFFFLPTALMDVQF